MLLVLLQAAEATTNWSEEVIAKATIVTAVAAILSFIATVLLWWTTKRSVDLTRDTFEAAHRPYVAAVGAVKRVQENPARCKFSVEFTNVGSVPAHDFKQEIQIIADGRVLPNMSLEEDPVAVVYPHIPLAIGTQTSNQDEYDSISNASALALVFRCSYKGVTQKQYRSEAKFKYNKETGEFGISKSSAT